MIMKRLIGMTDFVLAETKLWSGNENESYEIAKSCLKYAQFLKQPLELWMFVPCKLVYGVWVVLEEPECGLKEKCASPPCVEYQKAKERCLFEGFEYCESQSKGMLLKLNLFVSPYTDNRLYLTKKEHSGYHSWFQLFTIEYLVQCNLELTPTAIKQLEL